jgi:streptogramin lyase
MRESEIETYLAMQVRNYGAESRKVKWIGRRGAPDRVVFWPNGKCDWVELKAPGQKPRPQQEREHARMRYLRQSVVVLDSKEAVDKWLKGKTS